MLDVKSIKNLDIENKTVLVRFDLNIPLNQKNNHINDRITRIQNTIRHLQKLNSKILILSHLGRPNGIKNMDLSLKKVLDQLEKALGSEIYFIDDCVGIKVKEKIDSLEQNSIVLLENCRFYKGEEENDLTFAKELSRLADVYVNDAFACSHRSHASIVAITNYLPSYAGNLLAEELSNLNNIVEYPESPSITILGGSKVSTKIAVLKNISKKMDAIVICGGMANNFLSYSGYDIKNSLLEENVDHLVEEIITHAKTNNCKLIVPVDVVCAYKAVKDVDVQISLVNQIEDQNMILDIGPKTLEMIENEINNSKSIFWNGPVGVFEIPPFDKGTLQLAHFIAKKSINKQIRSFVGGGDTIAALDLAGVKDKFSYVSTGGGALLELLEGKKLPGLAALGVTE